jgi:hypothetical protein
MTYAMACLIEVIGRWHFKGVPMSRARVATMPPPHLRHLVTPEMMAAVEQSVAEYVPRLRRVVNDEPRLRHVPDDSIIVPAISNTSNHCCAFLPTTTHCFGSSIIVIFPIFENT